MRIVVISAPRTGNHWIECLLGTIYDLTHLSGADKPADTKARDFQAWADAGGFPDDAIFHLHCRYTSKLCDVIDAVPAHIVTVVRDPYDAFVSRYFWAQRRAPEAQGRAERRTWQQMTGKALDDPAVLAYLADHDGYGRDLRTAAGWMHGGRAAVIRYEDLHSDPVAALTRLTGEIAPVERERIEAALEACSAENMRRQSATMAWNVRVAKVGDSRERLSAAHLEIFRDRYAEQIRRLGYEVREPAAGGVSPPGVEARMPSRAMTSAR